MRGETNADHKKRRRQKNLKISLEGSKSRVYNEKSENEKGNNYEVVTSNSEITRSIKA